jgi:hypothetical protein
MSYSAVATSVYIAAGTTVAFAFAFASYHLFESISFG